MAISFRKAAGIVLLMLSLFLSLSTLGQVSINYPAPAQGLTRGLDQSVLTVQLGFNSSCASASVTVALPPAVSYVAGSVAKTGGSLAGAAIAESNISNLNAPVFSVTGTTAAGDITFTITRTASCGLAASGKDTIKVTGSCGSTTENNASTNTYNLLSPALSITPPAAITGAFINNTYTRSLTVTNGGNGCTDTLRYFAVYPGGGIVNTAAGNAITANGTSFNSTSSNGDTLFYKIYGAAIFGGDNLLCNGETVNITENIKVVKCNVTTAYGAGWGKTAAGQCQTATASSAATMAAGVPNLGISFSAAAPVASGACDGSRVTVTYTNNGTGGNAGALYDVAVMLGNTKVNGILGRFGFTADDPKLNGTGAVLAYTYAGGDAPNVVSASQFTTDPDGAGTGLDDLDGDGQFDDLAPGKSFSIIYTRKEITDLVTCPRSYYATASSQAQYNGMCKTSTPVTTVVTQSNINYRWVTNSISKLAPPSIYPGVPFTARICANGSYVPPGPRVTDSIEVFITLPPGVTYNGTSVFNGAGAPSYAVQTGQLLTIRQKWLGTTGGASGFCISFDMTYDCSGSAPIRIPYSVQYVEDRACNAINSISCGDTISTFAHCPSACPTGAANKAAIVQRTSFGWTDNTLTTKVNPASLPALSLKTVTNFDTLNIKQGGVQNGTYSNLYYFFQEDRAGGADVFQYLSGTFHFKAGGTGAEKICTLPAPDASGSTALLTKLTFNLSTLLGAGCGVPATVNPTDSFWVDMNYRINNANNSSLYGPTLQSPASSLAYFYNLDAANVPQSCEIATPEVYVIGLTTEGATDYTHAVTITGCASTVYNLQDYRLYNTEPIDVFPSEYRPVQYIDSAVVILPAGVYLDPSVQPTISYQGFSGLLSSTIGYTPVTPVVSGNRLTFINPGNWKTSDIAQNNFFANALLTYSILPSCSINPAQTNISVTYYKHDFYYSGLLPQSVATATRTNALTYNATTKPSISVQNNTGTVQGVLPQQYWDVQVNGTGTTTAPNLWMALEKGTGSGGISIDSIVLKPSNAVLTPAAYNTTDKWYKVSAAGIGSGASQQARVYFKYSSCTADSILFKAGWNCTGYPSPDPLTGYACTAAQQYLKIIPQPSQIQLSISRQPGNGSSISLCTTDSVLVVVNSAQAGNLLSPSVNVYPPAGVTIQTPIQIEYPLGSGSYQNATTTSVSGGYKIDLTSHTGIGASGLPGTILNAGAAGRQAKLKVMFSTSCGITSGSPLTFEGNGVQPCGAAATGSGATVQTAGISITGASTTGSAGVTVGISNASLVCGGTATLTLSTTPVIAPTQIGDTVIYTIPAGLAYSGGFTGSGFGIVTTAPGAGGTTIVKVPLPAGVASGTAINYSFNVTAGGIGGCSSTAITASAKRDIAPLVCGGVPCTGSSVVIGSGASSNITIAKPSLSTGAFTYTEALGTPRTINYSFSISNSGTVAAAAGAYLIKIYCGGNNTGKVLATFTNNAVAAGTAITQTGSFTYLSPSDCATGSAIFLQIQDTSAAGAKVCLCATPAGSSSAAHVLPVRLQSFTGAARGCNAALAWATAEEVNMSRFEVEQSTDNVHYKSIAVVTASRSSAGSSYAGLYSQPAGTAYYRLKMMSNDGTFTYSDVAPVRTACEGNTATAYPNPVMDFVTITGLVKSDIVRLTDVSGRLLLTLKAAGATEQADLSRYASGTYIIQVIRDGAAVQNIRIVKK